MSLEPHHPLPEPPLEVAETGEKDGGHSPDERLQPCWLARSGFILPLF